MLFCIYRKKNYYTFRDFPSTSEFYYLFNRFYQVVPFFSVSRFLLLCRAINCILLVVFYRQIYSSENNIIFNQKHRIVLSRIFWRKREREREGGKCAIEIV